MYHSSGHVASRWWWRCRSRTQNRRASWTHRHRHRNQYCDAPTPSAHPSSAAGTTRIPCRNCVCTGGRRAAAGTRVSGSPGDLHCSPDCTSVSTVHSRTAGQRGTRPAVRPHAGNHLEPDPCRPRQGSGASRAPMMTPTMTMTVMRTMQILQHRTPVSRAHSSGHSKAHPQAVSMAHLTDPDSALPGSVGGAANSSTMPQSRSAWRQTARGGSGVSARMGGRIHGSGWTRLIGRRRWCARCRRCGIWGR